MTDLQEKPDFTPILDYQEGEDGMDAVWMALFLTHPRVLPDSDENGSNDL